MRKPTAYRHDQHDEKENYGEFATFVLWGLPGCRIRQLRERRYTIKLQRRYRRLRYIESGARLLAGSTSVNC